MRLVYADVEDIGEISPDLTDEEVAQNDFGTYTE